MYYYSQLCGRTIRVDHVSEYRRPKDEDGKEIIEKGCAPRTPTPSPSPTDDESEKDVASSHKEKKKSKSKKHKDKKKKKAKHTGKDLESVTDHRTLKGPASMRAKTSPSDHTELIDADSNSPSHGHGRKEDKPRIGESEHSKNYSYRSKRSLPHLKERGRVDYIEGRDSGSRYRHRSRSRSRERRDERYSKYK